MPLDNFIANIALPRAILNIYNWPETFPTYIFKPSFENIHEEI